MRTVYKYDIPMSAIYFGQFAIDMPKYAEILCVQMQDGIPQLWAMVDSERDLVARSFFKAGTGQAMSNEKLIYIGTWQQPPFVWHLFEEIA